MSDLQSLFLELRALDWCHRAAHWQSSGSNAYQTHLLFERLYGVTVEEIDAFAEKLVGMLGEEAVCPVANAEKMVSFIKAAHGGEAIPSALEAEERFLRNIQEALGGEGWSVGVTNFLEDVADKHETHTYLLKQHLIAVPLVTQWGPMLGEE